ncbi:MAG: DUF6515 family protein [Rikenellaceae bacterium]
MNKRVSSTAKIRSLLSISSLVLFLMLGLCEPTSAQIVTRNRVPSRAIVVNRPAVKSVRTIRSSHATIRHNGVLLHISKGKFYRQVNSKYILSMPPIGVRVKTLPSSRVLFRYDNRPYYCYGGVIYRKIDSGEYEVASPKEGMIVPELPETGVTELSIDDKIYYEYDEILYKAVPTKRGVQYEVIENLK